MFGLYKAKISGERLQDQWSSGLHKFSNSIVMFSGDFRSDHVTFS